MKRFCTDRGGALAGELTGCGGGPDNTMTRLGSAGARARLRRAGRRPLPLRTLLRGAVVFGLLSAAAAASPAGTEKSLLAESQAALEDELYDLAQKKIAPFLASGALSPADKAAGTILLARALHGQRRYREMLALLTAGQDRPPGAPPAEDFDFWTALAYFELGQWEQALVCVSDFEKQYPASRYQPRVLRLQAWSCMNLGRRQEAIACFTRFAERYGNSPEGPANMLDGSKALLAAGNIETARNVLEQLLALGLQDRIGQEGRSLLGRIYVAEKKWTEARQVVMPLIDRQKVPDELRAAAFYCLSDMAEAQSNLVGALGWLDKAAEQMADPSLKRELNLRKGRLLLRMGKVDEGVTLVRGYVAAQSTNASAREAHLQLAETLLERGLNDKALREFQNYLETFSEPAGVFKAHLGKGWALLRLGRMTEAAASFERACASASTPDETAYCRFKVADCQFAGGQYKLAAESYGWIVERFPQTDLAGQALLLAAECHARLGDLANAEHLFWEAADVVGSSAPAAQALLRVAELRQQQGAAAESRAIYRLVLAEFDGAERDRARLGIAFLDYRMERFQEALDGFQGVVPSSPQGDGADLALYMVGWCHARLGRLDLAADTFRGFVRSHPRSPWAADALFWLAEQDFNRGRYDLAESVWVGLAKEYPRAAPAEEALFWAGRAALQQKEYLRARDHFSLLVKNYPSGRRRAEARFYQGQALGELGEFAGLILVMDEIIKQFPDSELAEAAWLRKGDGQFTLGAEDPKRYEEAVASYRRILERPAVTELAKLEVEYKIGRCLEKAGRPADAFEHYMKAIYGYFKHPELKPQGNVWLTRAAFSAAGIKEDEKSWRKAAAIYQRVVDAGIPASRDAKERIDKIRADNWTHFF